MLLRILATPRRIASLPWELIYDPDTITGTSGGGEPLAVARDVHVVRMGRVRTYPVEPVQFSPPLRILLILSSPPTEEDGVDLAFDLYEEKRHLLAELQPLVANGLVEVDVEDRPTTERLRRQIAGRARGYHVVHYVGHANPDGLILEGDGGRAAPIPETVFTRLLRQCPDLVMVVFAGCETAQSPSETSDHEWPGRLSLSEACVRDACQVVIGMQAILPFTTERTFTGFFYRGLTSGRTIADAVRLARAAVRDQDAEGMLNWAVPTMFVGGESADALINLDAPPRPVVEHRREELKFGFVEGEREFLGRDAQLRPAIDFLTGRSRDRVLWVTGPGDEPARLVARALEDVGEAIDYTLWAPWDTPAGGSDSAMLLCKWVAELLSRTNPGLRPPEDNWGGNAWWSRLLEEIVRQRFAIVIDNADHYSLGAADELRDALVELVRRRGDARLVLLGEEPSDALLAKAVDYAQVTPLKLLPLGWAEIWPWIRRTRPSLLRFDSPALEARFADLGSDLKRWDALARAAGQLPEAKLSTLVEMVGPTQAPTRLSRNWMRPRNRMI